MIERRFEFEGVDMRDDAEAAITELIADKMGYGDYGTIGIGSEFGLVAECRIGKLEEGDPRGVYEIDLSGLPGVAGFPHFYVCPRAAVHELFEYIGYHVNKKKGEVVN